MTVPYWPISAFPQSSPTRIPKSGNSVDHCYYKRKAIKLPIWNWMDILRNLNNLVHEALLPLNKKGPSTNYAWKPQRILSFWLVFQLKMYLNGGPRSRHALHWKRNKGWFVLYIIMKKVCILDIFKSLHIHNVNMKFWNKINHLFKFPTYRYTSQKLCAVILYFPGIFETFWRS